MIHLLDSVKFFIVALVMVLPVFSEPVVRRTENLNFAVEMLSYELHELQQNKDIELSRLEKQCDVYRNSLRHMVDRAEELSLVLYSLENENIFALAYFCRQFQELYDYYKSQQYPFEEWNKKILIDIERYAKLKVALEEIPATSLNEKALKLKDEAIENCRDIEQTLLEFKKELDVENAYFKELGKKMDVLDEYTSKRFDFLRWRIFMNGSEPYHSVLSNLPEYWDNIKMSVKHLYFTEDSITKKWVSGLEKMALFCVLFFLISIAFSYACFKWCIPKRWKVPEVQAKRWYYRGCFVLLFFSILFVGIRLLGTENAFIRNALMLIIEYSWLVLAILISLIIRLKSDKIGKGFLLYLPIVILGACLILFRILIVPNNVVHLFFPILLGLIIIIHLIILVTSSRGATRTDMFYSWFSLLVCIACFIVSWMGFRYMGLQFILLWLLLLTAIESLIALKNLLDMVENGFNHKREQGYKMKMKWAVYFVKKLVFPLLTVFGLVGSVVWAAWVFDLSIILLEWIDQDFFSMEQVASISVKKIIWVSCLAIVINYVLFVVKEVLRSIYGHDYESGALPTFVTIGTLVIWGIYVFVSMLILNVNYSGLMVIMGGLSMGIGFALKDTIDNLICGMSLLLGRVRLGDIVECDGVRGRIRSIGYRSTTLETIDGSIIVFLNNQLFTKNFKNLTKNHTYELSSFTVGISYGSDVEKVRGIILEELKSLHALDPSKSPSVYLDEFGDSSINLQIYLWVPVREKFLILSEARERVYSAFNREGIEMPSPQCDVHLTGGEILAKGLLS